MLEAPTAVANDIEIKPSLLNKSAINFSQRPGGAHYKHSPRDHNRLRQILTSLVKYPLQDRLEIYQGQPKFTGEH